MVGTLRGMGDSNRRRCFFRETAVSERLRCTFFSVRRDLERSENDSQEVFPGTLKMAFNKESANEAYVVVTSQ